MHTVEKFDKFLSEEEFAKSQNAVNTNFSLRIPNKKVNGNLPSILTFENCINIISKIWKIFHYW